MRDSPTFGPTCALALALAGEQAKELLKDMKSRSQVPLLKKKKKKKKKKKNTVFRATNLEAERLVEEQAEDEEERRVAGQRWALAEELTVASLEHPAAFQGPLNQRRKKRSAKNLIDDFRSLGRTCKNWDLTKKLNNAGFFLVFFWFFFFFLFWRCKIFEAFF